MRAPVSVRPAAKVCFSDHETVRDLVIVDTPGIVPGMQASRAYDFLAVTHWFAKRADLVVLLFDAHKVAFCPIGL